MRYRTWRRRSSATADGAPAGSLRQLPEPRDPAAAFADDATLTAAMLDRLLHHAHIAQSQGDSHRLKDKRKAGLIRKSTAENPAKINP